MCIRDRMAGIQRLAGVVESQKTLDIQKDGEREVKEIMVKAGDEVDVGTPLFTYDTATTETELQQAQLDLERASGNMEKMCIRDSPYSMGGYSFGRAGNL